MGQGTKAPQLGKLQFNIFISTVEFNIFIVNLYMSSLFLPFSCSVVLIPISKSTMVKILMADAIFSTIKAYNFKTICLYWFKFYVLVKILSNFLGQIFVLVTLFTVINYCLIDNTVYIGMNTPSGIKIKMLARK